MTLTAELKTSFPSKPQCTFTYVYGNLLFGSVLILLRACRVLAVLMSSDEFFISSTMLFTNVRLSFTRVNVADSSFILVLYVYVRSNSYMVLQSVKCFQQRFSRLLDVPSYIRVRTFTFFTYSVF